MLAIGELARLSGLTVSALRFYDGAGLLRPAFVDPLSGYRRYATDQVGPARLVAALRRVGMPLPDIALVLSRWPAPSVEEVLDAHLQRLETGLADARRELSRVRSSLHPVESPVSVQLDAVPLAAAALAAAIDAVRFTVGADPAHPMLSGVHLTLADGLLTLAATDRYRLAVSSVPASGTGSALVPAFFIDSVRALLGAEPVPLSLSASSVSLAGVATEPLPYDFPDHRTLLPARAGGIPVSAPTLRAAVSAAPTSTMTREQDGADFDVVVLSVSGDAVAAGPDPSADVEIGVNREFLLDALTAPAADQLTLSLDGPLLPLVITAGSSYSLLMPTRLS